MRALLTVPAMRISEIFPFLSLAIAMALSACGKQGDDVPKPEPAGTTMESAQQAQAAALPPGIDWFAGDADAAFAAGKSSGKPIFLYWGAEWCPPCAQIKATIFNRREFQERSRLFVPLYLDGDTPSAQRLGEQFGVIGYPTMILFRPDGTEITRLPGGVDVERYTNILDVALADARPVAEILAQATRGETISANDWRLLAYYSWGTDNGRVLAEDQRVVAFKTLFDACPASLRADCARLYFEYLGAAALASDRTGQSALSTAERTDAQEQLLDLLDEPAVQDANIQNLLYGAEPVVGLLSVEQSAERSELIAAWASALTRLQALDGNDALSSAEQLNLVRARLVLARLQTPDDELPAELLDEARSAIARIDASTTDPYERQTAMNAATNLYWEAGLDAEARAMLQAELARSKSPYYFMLSLAEFAERAGRESEALDWLARAYEDAHGPATRFQWGYSYLMGLLQMAPDDTRTIERVGLEVIGELDDSPDAFYQRTRLRLESLNDKLLEWGQDGEREKVIDALRARAGQICLHLPEADKGRKSCEQFLNPGGTTGRGA
jgi:thioredoxin-related protein